MSRPKPLGPRRPSGTDLATSFAVAAGVVFLVWITLPHLDQPRNATPRSQCKNNLKQLGLALHNYHDTYGSFPPAVTYGPDGKPWHSWRTLLLPYLEAKPLYDRYRFDEPWDGPNNAALAAEMPAVFRCPKDDRSPAGVTSYVAVVGEGTMWPADGAARIADAADGPDRTLLVVEVSDGGVPWTRPLDLRSDAMGFAVNGTRVGPRSRHVENGWIYDGPPLGANALMTDGSVRFLRSELPAEAVRSVVLRDDGGPTGD